MDAMAHREIAGEQQDSGGVGGALRRTVREFSDDGLSHWAAALTYYAVLAIFPALLALVSILGLIGTSATKPLLDNLDSVAPGPARDVLTSSLESIGSGQGAAGLTFVIGLLASIWAASGYIGAFMDASNTIWDVDEGRPFWKKIPIRLAITIAMLILLAVSAALVVVTGPIAQQIGNLIGVGDTAVSVWNIAKWPALLIVASGMLALLYWAAPNVKQPGFRWISPGSVVAVVLWLLASAVFAFYVANFGSYNKTYGSLGGIIVFLIWLWITNIAILLGAELNAELERGHQIEQGHPADREPFLEVRDEPASDRS